MGPARVLPQTTVMARFSRAIHVLFSPGKNKVVDTPDKPGHDELKNND
jgi:hypothetical protein